ncbi:MAG: glycosyltransferase family 39 protein [Pseudomonadota bacterium]|nr:glycosyltransferase family 39 protein [Pseudomonadota bacterium]
MLSRSPLMILALLFFVALLALFPGIGELTGITGKDEYYLTIRTPMHMIEGSHGWLPWLDGMPRLQKPPLMYWLGKIGYELFGISLVSARMIGVFFAAILVVTTAALSWFSNKDKKMAILTGLVTLGMAGVMIDGRRYLLDIPVAAFSGLSILFLLLWDRKSSFIYLFTSMIFLGLAFLTKGPVTLIFYLAAIVSWRLTRPENIVRRPRYWQQWTASLTVAFLIVLPWYFYIYQHYPDELSSTLLQETNDRNILDFSLSPLLNLTVLGLPWSIILLALLLNYFRTHDSGKRNSNSNIIFLAAWLLLSILPFFFFKTFSRYLYGCLIPVSILIPTLLNHHPDITIFKYWFRTAAIISSLIGFTLLTLVLWFRGFDLALFFSFLMIVVFIYCWWQAKNPMALALTSVLYWLSVTAIIYPRIGINAIPVGVESLIKNEYTVLYAGPQPAMLPAATGRGLRATSRLWTLPDDIMKNCKGILLFTPQDMLGMAKKQMGDLKLKYDVLNKYKILSSRGSWVKFTKEGTTYSDWLQAIRLKNIDSLGTTIFLLRVKSIDCN